MLRSILSLSACHWCIRDRTNLVVLLRAPFICCMILVANWDCRINAFNNSRTTPRARSNPRRQPHSPSPSSPSPPLPPKLSLLHALSNVPVHERPLGVHQVKLVVQACPCLPDCSGVAEHAHCTLCGSNVISGNDSRCLIVYSDFEARRTPIHKLNRPLCLHRGDGGGDVLGGDISTVEQATRHVLSVARITLHHLTSCLEAACRDLGNRHLLMIGLGLAHDGGEGDEGKVDAGVGDKIGLELVQVHIQSILGIAGMQ